jgi:hypothetical protein
VRVGVTTDAMLAVGAARGVVITATEDAVVFDTARTTEWTVCIDQAARSIRVLTWAHALVIQTNHFCDQGGFIPTSSHSLDAVGGALTKKIAAYVTSQTAPSTAILIGPRALRIAQARTVNTRRQFFARPIQAGFGKGGGQARRIQLEGRGTVLATSVALILAPARLATDRLGVFDAQTIGACRTNGAADFGANSRLPSRQIRAGKCGFFRDTDGTNP